MKKKYLNELTMIKISRELRGYNNNRQRNNGKTTLPTPSKRM